MAGSLVGKGTGIRVSPTWIMIQILLIDYGDLASFLFFFFKLSELVFLTVEMEIAATLLGFVDHNEIIQVKFILTFIKYPTNVSCH